MTYATKPQLVDLYGEDELIQLTDREQPGTGAVVDAVLDRALATADGIVDGYVGTRYPVPLAVVPAVVASIAASITRWSLYGRTVPDAVDAAYKESMRQLRDIADGRMTLGVPAGAEPKKPTADVQFNDTPRVFARD